MNEVSMDEMWNTAKELSLQIYRASWTDRNKPHVQYPWVAGYMEALFKNLPRTSENLKFLQSEIGTLQKYIKEYS